MASLSKPIALEPMADSLVASVSSRNAQSIAFHCKNGFRPCGRFEKAGHKSGQDFDILWMQRRLS